MREGAGSSPLTRGKRQDADRLACPSGSSPLTRGKPVSSGGARVSPRLIPAHAGKTRFLPLVIAHCWAHPRSRGENLRGSQPPIRMQGSSPLTRGKPGARAVSGLGRRLIPAHAGKTPTRRVAIYYTTAHPRSRGENAKPDPHRLVEPGSSPLTRGKRGDGNSPGFAARLIPAHAGKTTATMQRAVARKAHPRSRGEN